MAISDKKVILCCSGGGNRTVFHAGVYQALKDAGITIKHVFTVSGSSVTVPLSMVHQPKFMIRFVAATNVTKFIDYYETFEQIQENHALGAINPLFGKLIRTTFGVTTAKTLPDSTSIVATDFNTGKPVYLTDAPIGTAVSASMALPGLFKPVDYEGKPLVDGGVGEKIPVSQLSSMKEEKDIAVAVWFPEFSRRVIVQSMLSLAPKKMLAVKGVKYLLTADPKTKKLLEQFRTRQADLSKIDLNIQVKSLGFSFTKTNTSVLSQAYKLGYQTGQRVTHMVLYYDKLESDDKLMTV